ncbi:MAG: hypothetical protein JSU85_14960 [Candidatus Zixiibacteriota bacterium]|nr:MAG: hypothetical protein JSU85_14960 [candidate division Zixibacteria bacterium]
MLKQSTVGKPVIFLVLFMAVMFIAGQADAQTKISGKMTMAYAKMDSIPVSDTEDHNMALAESKGNNISTGDNAFMDGAEIINFSYADLTKGSGPHQGYVTFKKGDDMTIAKWKGKVKTTMTEEGAPKTTFSGTFEYIKGAGQFKNIKGAGTYEGHFTSSTEYIVGWKAEYTLK